MAIIGIYKAVMDELLRTSPCSIKYKDLLSSPEIASCLAHCSPTLGMEIRRKLSQLKQRNNQSAKEKRTENLDDFVNDAFTFTCPSW